MDSPDINEKVRHEMRRFREALPRLLELYPGKWVVFRGGEVQSLHESSADAHKAGVERFGLFGGQVIARVAAEEPRLISASAIFSHRI